MKVEFPTEFSMDYTKLENKRYYNSNNKPILYKKLLEASNSYCMYCGKSLLNESDPAFHMEHSVDKGGNENQGEETTFLTHCKFNFSVSCPYCNTVCKKIIEKVDFNNVNLTIDCFGKKCNEMCSKYRDLRDQYASKNGIIIQPQGITLREHRLKIYYDLFQNLYEPDDTILNPEELFFIHNHIRRFQLNGLRFSESIIDMCADIVILYESGINDKIEIFRFLKSRRASNIIAERFIDYCEDTFANSDTEKIADFCRLIVLLNAAD